MSRLRPLASGLVGAGTLTLLHETSRRVLPHPPRMDVLGMRAIARSLRAVDQAPPPHDQLFWLTLAGDLVANSVYYSLVNAGAREGIWRRGVLLGLAAGLGAVFLPGPLGLGQQPQAAAPETPALTVGLYLAGGLAAAAAARRLRK